MKILAIKTSKNIQKLLVFSVKNTPYNVIQGNLSLKIHKTHKTQTPYDTIGLCGAFIFNLFLSVPNADTTKTIKSYNLHCKNTVGLLCKN